MKIINKKKARLFRHIITKKCHYDPAFTLQNQTESNNLSLLLISHAFPLKFHFFLSLDSLLFSLSVSPMANLFAYGALWFCLAVMVICPKHCVSARSDQEIRDRFYGNLINASAPQSGDGSIAKMFDRVLEKEFSDNDQPEGRVIASLFLIESSWMRFFFLKTALLAQKSSNYR